MSNPVNGAENDCFNSNRVSVGSNGLDLQLIAQSTNCTRSGSAFTALILPALLLLILRAGLQMVIHLLMATWKLRSIFSHQMLVIPWLTGLVLDYYPA